MKGVTIVFRKIYHFCLIILCLPHIVLYKMSKQKGLIDADLKSYKCHNNTPYNGLIWFVVLLFNNIYFRNIFYMRIGKLSGVCKWYLPGDKTFYPCPNIGGGIYAAHPFSTILNAKSIGSNFSFRNNTTVGNKRDGEGFNGPVIKDNVMLGANVCVIGDVVIGNNVIVGAGSVVIKDVPDNCVVAGNPAKIIKRINEF